MENNETLNYGYGRNDREQLAPKLPISLHRKFNESAKLNECLTELQFISMDNILLWLKARGKVLSNKSITIFLMDMVTEGLLKEENDPNLGQHYVRTDKFKKLNAIAVEKLESQARIQELKKQGYR